MVIKTFYMVVLYIDLFRLLKLMDLFLRDLSLCSKTDALWTWIFTSLMTLLSPVISLGYSMRDTDGSFR